MASRRQWRSACVSIYCSRVFLSLNRVDKNSCFNISPKHLTDLVKEKKPNSVKHLGGVESIASALQTDITTGIDGHKNDVARRQKAFGSNSYNKPRTKSFFHFVVSAFKDVTILILMACGVLSHDFGIKKHGITDGWYDGGSIFAAVFLVIAVSAVSNFRKNRQFEKLSAESGDIQIHVVRDGGRRQQMSICDIVVGDIVLLSIGDQVPADGLFVDGHSLLVDESSMTGESNHVKVNRHSHPFLVSGTKVVDGYARMLVTSVGMNTTWGEMMSSKTRDTNHQTPLQARLNKLTSSIGKVGLAATISTIVLMISSELVLLLLNSRFPFSSRVALCCHVLAVTIIVVAIPEGLPTAVMLTVEYSMWMMRDRAKVRKLSACETTGSATTICTDKTGTLTMNKMTVTKFWVGQEEAAVLVSVSPQVLDLIREGVAMNTTGGVYRSSSSNTVEFSGSPTEKAILSWAVTALNTDIEEVKKSCTVVHVEVFNSEKKRSGVRLMNHNKSSIHVHWKGAAEMILARCSSYYDASGVIKDLDEDERMKMENVIKGMAASSLRCIAFAYKAAQPDEVDLVEEEDYNLTLLGLIGMKNLCRPGVKTAVQACQEAGVTVKMITGDNVFTAKAIATECGILRRNDAAAAVVEGVEFRNYTHKERMEKVEKIRVMARSSPFDKLSWYNA